MSGLVIDDGFPKLISSRTHSIIDYIHTGTNFLTAASFGPEMCPANAAFALGVGILVNTP
jgi:hypothetical protein